MLATQQREDSSPDTVILHEWEKLWSEKNDKSITLMAKISTPNR